jgi:hypothetical protein
MSAQVRWYEHVQKMKEGALKTKECYLKECY